MLGLRFCARAFSSCGKRAPLFITVRGPLTIVASLVVEHRLQTRRLSSCGSRAQLLRSMWDLPRPGLEPVSPALAGRFSTTAPPGKPCSLVLMIVFLASVHSKYTSEPIWQGNGCGGNSGISGSGILAGTSGSGDMVPSLSYTSRPMDFKLCSWFLYSTSQGPKIMAVPTTY